MKFCRGLIVFLVGVSLLYAGDPWKSKTPEKWDKDDVETILRDSPWGKVITSEEKQVRQEDKTAGGGGRGTTSPQGFERGDTQASEFARVIWWSAKTPRRALIRKVELGGFQVGAEQAKKFSESDMEQHVISVEDTKTSRMRTAEKLSPEELKQAAWLEIPSQKRKIECTDAAVIKDAKGGIERIIFRFPRQIDGQPVIKSDEKKVVFKWKLPDTAQGRPAKGQPPAEIKMSEAKQFEVSFEPKKMLLNGQMDN